MKIIAIVLTILAVIFLSLYARMAYLDNIERDYNQRLQIGVYRFDARRTDLGRYSTDSLKFNKMTITFRSNNTFTFNMDAPFICDSTGTWRSGGASIDEWSELRYNNSPVITQFSWIDNNEDDIYINSMTPKHGQAHIQALYFERVK